MAYNASYDQSDFQNIVVDGLGTGGASLVVWIPILVLGAILVTLIGIYRKMTKAFK